MRAICVSTRYALRGVGRDLYHIASRSDISLLQCKNIALRNNISQINTLFVPAGASPRPTLRARYRKTHVIARSAATWQSLCNICRNRTLFREIPTTSLRTGLGMTSRRGEHRSSAELLTYFPPLRGSLPRPTRSDAHRPPPPGRAPERAKTRAIPPPSAPAQRRRRSGRPRTPAGNRLA